MKFNVLKEGRSVGILKSKTKYNESGNWDVFLNQKRVLQRYFTRWLENVRVEWFPSKVQMNLTVAGRVGVFRPLNL